MTPHLARIWRHPVKSIGCEALPRVTLAAGRPMPHDRLWAVAHGGSSWRAEAPGWEGCNNFLRVTHAPRLAAVSARYDPATGSLTLAHPARESLTVDPATPDGAARLCDWVSPMAEGARPGPYRLAHAPDAAMTDMAEPFISVLSLASLRALSERLGIAPDPRRFRGNLWLDGVVPWEEEDWVGRTLRIGGALLRVVEPIGRCRATEANPETGHRDAAILDTLRAARGHTRFGLYAEVLEGGEIAEGAAVEIA
ncbi:MOSC domain-containing protein [Limibaculum sp. FT325]|uniref:MOSC domain-containing protein n=1 Tax=Thermohalobaculum sediminis TaxID=2939436 RepID=UPI0020BDE488|nr:MOSC domain-containing protein [Limibaculum sediminis]MCL5778933.1 MOSC domain-containing protein [Limibaculum sediminis]